MYPKMRFPLTQGVPLHKVLHEVSPWRRRGVPFDFPYTVEPLYYGHQGDRDKCPHYKGVRFREVGFIWISVSQGPSKLSVIERCPY